MGIPSIHENNIPQQLKDLPYWRVWFGKKKKNKKGIDKLPTNNGKTLLKGWGDPKNDLTYIQAVQLFDRLNLSKRGGIGFRLDLEANIIAIDFDNTLTPPDLIKGTYTEISPSGNGIRQFLIGCASRDCSNHTTGVEIYSGHSTRFVTVTGNILGSVTTIKKDTGTIEKLLAKHRVVGAHKLNGQFPPVPDLDDLVQYDVEHTALPASIKDSILTGDASHYGTESGDRSAMLMGISKTLHNRHLTPEQILSVLLFNPCNGKALEQSRDLESAARWLWRYCVVPAVGAMPDRTKTPAKPAKTKATSDPEFSDKIPVPIAESIRQYIDGRMLRYQPEFAIAATLAFLSALHGNRYVGHIKGTRLNIYSFLVGPPGSSKTEPLTAIKNLCRACEETPIFEIERVGSSEGLEDCIIEHPSVLWIWEEAGKRLGHFNDKNVSPHAAAIPDMIVALYSASGSSYRKRLTAQKKDGETRVNKPFLSVIGVMTDTELDNLLTQSAISGGLVSRCLVTKVTKKGLLRKDHKAKKIPKDVVDFIRSRARPNKVSGGTGKSLIDIIIKETASVTKIFDKFQLEQDKLESKSKEESDRDVRTRVEENARRVACILAATSNPDNPVITEAIARWSIAHVRKSVNMLVLETGFSTGESDYHISRAKVLRILKKTKEYSSARPEAKKELSEGLMPRYILLQNSHLRSRDLDEVVKTLVETKEIGCEKVGSVTYYWLAGEE